MASEFRLASFIASLGSPLFIIIRQNNFLPNFYYERHRISIKYKVVPQSEWRSEIDLDRPDVAEWKFDDKGRFPAAADQVRERQGHLDRFQEIGPKAQ